MIKIKADTRDLQRLSKDLKRLSEGGARRAIAQAVTDVAFQARREWQHELESKLILRNRWTTGSIRAERATASGRGPIISRVGTLVPYLDVQETGGALGPARGGQAKAIPAVGARRGGGKRGLVPGPSQVQNIRLARVSVSGSQARQNAATLSNARRKGQKFVLLSKGTKRGIFQLGRGKRSKPKFVQDLSHRSVSIKPTPTMQPAVVRAVKFAPQAFRAALTFQLRRLKTFR